MGCKKLHAKGGEAGTGCTGRRWMPIPGGSHGQAGQFSSCPLVTGIREYCALV